MKSFRIATLAIVALVVAVSGHAQATRTWVSGVGDDANPCSRTAPCKTWAGAISKTAANGEISALDPGGFGVVTITKSITLDGAGTLASILSAGSPASIVINAATTDKVQIRNITMNGANSGINGINIFQAGQVVIENCTLWNFNNGLNTSKGIRIANSSNVVKVSVINSTIHTINGFGISSESTMSGAAFLSLENVRISGVTQNAVELDNASNATISRSNLSENGGAGLRARRSNVEVTVFDTVMFRNGTGIAVGDAGGGLVRLFASSIVTNGNGIQITAGTVATHNNNSITGNGGTQATNLSLNMQ